MRDLDVKCVCGHRRHDHYANSEMCLSCAPAGLCRKFVDLRMVEGSVNDLISAVVDDSIRKFAALESPKPITRAEAAPVEAPPKSQEQIVDTRDDTEIRFSLLELDLSDEET